MKVKQSSLIKAGSVCMALFFSPFFFLPFFFIFNNFDKPPFDLSLSLFNAEVTQGDQTHDPYLQLAVSTSLSSRLSLFLPDKKEIFSWGLIWAFYSTWTELNQNHEKVLLSALKQHFFYSRHGRWALETEKNSFDNSADGWYPFHCARKKFKFSLSIRRPSVRRVVVLWRHRGTV